MILLITKLCLLPSSICPDCVEAGIESTEANNSKKRTREGGPNLLCGRHDVCPSLFAEKLDVSLCGDHTYCIILFLFFSYPFVSLRLIPLRSQTIQQEQLLDPDEGFFSAAASSCSHPWVSDLKQEPSFKLCGPISKSFNVA